MKAVTSLGQLMRDRREELRISQSAAARAAGVARSTWVNWEKDVSQPERFNFAAIDDVLEWERKHGVDEIRAGRDPVARRKAHSPPDIPALARELMLPVEKVRGWFENRALEPIDREILIGAYRVDAERRRAAQAERERRPPRGA